MGAGPRSFRRRFGTTMCGSSNEQHSLLRIHGALTAVAILFSSNYIISKLAMNAFSPMSFAYLRVVGAAIVLSALTAREPSPRLRGEGRVRGGKRRDPARFSPVHTAIEVDNFVARRHPRVVCRGT